MTEKPILVFIPYYLLSVVIAAIICCCSGLSGWRTAVLLVGCCLGTFLALLLLSILLLAVISLLLDPEKQQPSRSGFFAGLVSFGMGAILGLSSVRLHVSGMEKLPGGRFLLVQNHRSNFDPIVTGWALRKQQLVFISKPQNFKLPVVGPILHRAGHIAIDRENDRAALRTILAAADLLKRDVENIGIYPEGTRNPGEELLPFRSGAFKIAQKADVPIVVTAVRGTDEVQRNAPWKVTDVYLDICTVLDAEAIHSMTTAEIGEEVRKGMTAPQR